MTCNCVNGPYYAPYFTAEERLLLMQSESGVDFTSLRCRRTPDDVPVRDPSLLIHDGFWWIVHTTANFVAGDSFALVKSIAKAGDFIEITNPSVASITGVQSPWGPKWFTDPEDGSLHVIICCSVNLNTGPFKMYELHPTDTDMTSWSDPIEISGTFPTNIIDAFMFVKSTDPGAYYILFKNEDTKYLEVLRSTEGPWSGYVVDENATEHDGGFGIEGCSVVNQGGLNWLEYADFYDAATGIHVRASTDDMETWGEWEPIKTPYALPRNGVFIKHP